MVLRSKLGRLLLLLLVWASAPVPTTLAQNSFAVVQLANATDDMPINYQFKWGDNNQHYIIKSYKHSSHYYPQDLEIQNTFPNPQIEFETGITQYRTKQAYTLRPSVSPKRDDGGNWYVFVKRTDAHGEDYIDLLHVSTFLDYSGKLVSTLIAQKDYAEAIRLCDRVLGVDSAHVQTLNYRGRAHYLAKNHQRAVDDFSKAISLGPKQAIYHNNRGYSYIALNQYDKALADFDVAIELDPKLANSYKGRDLAKAGLGDVAGPRLDIARTASNEPGRQRRTEPVFLQETRLETSERERDVRSLPKEFEPYITPEAYRALETYRLGSKVDADENYRLQVAYDRAYEEGRYIDAQEANYIRAIEREPVAALWKMLTGPAGNNYYLPKFTPVEERLDGLKRPLLGKGSDRLIYVKSDDDLAGLRIAIRRPPQERDDGGLETAAILPFRWVKGSGIVPLDPPDNLRVLIRLKKDGEHAMLGMSFSLTKATDGSWDLRPEIYTSPKFGEDRFKVAASTVVSPRGCMDCHSLGFNLSASKFVGPAAPSGDAEFAAAIKEMPGVAGFLDDARKRGASEQEITQAESIVVRPDVNILKWRSLRIAVIKLWNAIYYANQPYLDDADARFVEYHDRYGSAWLEAGDLDTALEHFNKAVIRGPDIAALYLKRGWIYLEIGEYERSLADANDAIRLESRSMASQNLRARLLATAPLASLRNGAEAVRAATQACELTGWKSREYLETLAAAYAESAKFSEAVKWQEKALADPDLAESSGADEINAARNRLDLYRRNLPFRDSPRSKTK